MGKMCIRDRRKTVLVDSVQKKMAIVGSVLSELGIAEQISTYGGRIEYLAHECPCVFTALTARALSKLSVLMELASPLPVSYTHLDVYKRQVHDLVHQVMQAARARRADVHARTLADRLQALEDLNVRTVVMVRFVCH